MVNKVQLCVVHGLGYGYSFMNQNYGSYTKEHLKLSFYVWGFLIFKLINDLCK
jgi:hypothetical protein